MPRQPNPKCVYCAKNYRTEDEAKAKHPECYVEHNCRIKRNRLRNPGKINAQRRANYAKKLGISTIEPILPDAYRAELALYGKENQFVHAIALEIFQGNQLSHKMHPQHTQGLRQPELEAYLQKLLSHLELKFGIDCFGLIYWVHPNDCPVCKSV
jgi:hypothetical protein